MTLINLSTLLRGRSAAQVFNDALAYIAAPPDPTLQVVRTTNWRPGGPYKTLLNRLGLEIELLYQQAASLAGSGFIRYAPGRDPANPTAMSWLQWLGEDFFGEPQMGATPAKVTVTVNVAAGFGPYGPEVLRVKASNGQFFKSDATVTLAAGASSVPLAFTAELAGAAANVGAHTITQLVSPNVLGITLDNAAAALGGADIEPDDRYRTRLAAKWGVLSTGSTVAAYIYWALTASLEVAKVAVLESNNNGVFASNYVTLVLAGAGGTVTAGAVTTVQNYVRVRQPIGTSLFTKSAVVYNLALAGNVKVIASALASAPTDIANSCAALDLRVPIGGYNGVGVGLSEFISAVAFDGSKVLDVPLSNPAANVSLAFDQLLVTNPAGLVLIPVP